MLWLLALTSAGCSTCTSSAASLAGRRISSCALLLAGRRIWLARQKTFYAGRIAKLVALLEDVQRHRPATNDQDLLGLLGHWHAPQQVVDVAVELRADEFLTHE